ncbi:MAG: hypothetical protein A2Y65_10450 [Deltaproteobacteria bacterium RBG_13_52_11]|nr:MAG: hypothetical protein A2Y65_10450 [Deltaproteobacteria bacterium RBG_13_52_11]
MDIIRIHETSIILGLPEFLIRDFVSFEFNSRKLERAGKDPSAYEFKLSEVYEFQRHLDAPWPGTERFDPPDYVKRYLTYEAEGGCALCRDQKPNYEYAHIRPWPDSRCNNPHNLLRLCLDCHRSHEKDKKLLQGVKEESLRRIQLVDMSLLYECDHDISPGEAVYILEGHVYRAHAGETREYLASGFVQTKIGIHRCTVQRSGVVVSIGGLEPGKDYVLSPSEPGKIVTRAVFDATRDMSGETLVQFVGRAESSTHLAVGSLGTDFSVRPGARIDS